MAKIILTRWALIEPSRIGLASSAGLPNEDDSFLYRPEPHCHRSLAPLAYIIDIDHRPHLDSST